MSRDCDALSVPGRLVRTRSLEVARLRPSELRAARMPEGGHEATREEALRAPGAARGRALGRGRADAPVGTLGRCAPSYALPQARACRGRRGAGVVHAMALRRRSRPARRRVDRASVPAERGDLVSTLQRRRPAARAARRRSDQTRSLRRASGRAGRSPEVLVYRPARARLAATLGAAGLLRVPPRAGKALARGAVLRQIVPVLVAVDAARELLGDPSSRAISARGRRARTLAGSAGASGPLHQVRRSDGSG